LTGDPTEDVGWRAVADASDEFSTDPTPLAERDYPQGDPVHPQAGNVSRETASDAVSRETRPAWQVRTAAELAERDETFHDHGTPLAQAAQHSVLARTGGLRRQGVARPDATRVLVVANKTAATPALLDAVRERAAAGPCEFTLLVPNATHGLHTLVDPEDQEQTEAEATIELALPLLEDAAGGPVDAMVGVPEPLAAIQDAVNLHGFDEIVISTLPKRLSRWLRLDLPSKAAGLGLPVTTVTARGREHTPA
jgi:hypothetical protein